MGFRRKRSDETYRRSYVRTKFQEQDTKLIHKGYLRHWWILGKLESTRVSKRNRWESWDGGEVDVTLGE